MGRCARFISDFLIWETLFRGTDKLFSANYKPVAVHNRQASDNYVRLGLVCAKHNNNNYYYLFVAKQTYFYTVIRRTVLLDFFNSEFYARQHPAITWC